jgi:hypothetical protein
VLDPDQLFRAIVILNALFASMAWCLARPTTASLLSVLSLAVLWPFFDKPLSGRILYVISPTKGVTTADLISVLAVILVTVQVARLRLQPADND